ncbi:hypothetical protein, partial [Mycobacterium sp. 050134]|uniref:hypothetical protein n=1 Tax=Mycobacterium sp. 050134 TaxID=3096111 RepID=UPI002ED9FE5F
MTELTPEGLAEESGWTRRRPTRTTRLEYTDPDPVDWGRLPSTIVYSALANILTLQQLTGLAIPF